MGIIVDVGHRPSVVWAPHAAERWLPTPLAAPRLISLPAAAPAPAIAPTRAAGEPSRMVAMARVLATWRAAERQVASMDASDVGRDLAEAAVEMARADYHRLFAANWAGPSRR